MAPDVRDAVVDFVRTWSVKAGLTAGRFLRWIGLAPSTYHTWKERYGKANEHNGDVPRDHWLTAAERKAIIDFHHQFPLEGYRRLTFMLIDRNIVACSPATVYRVLSQAGLLQRWKPKTSLKGTGFVQPLRPHESVAGPVIESDEFRVRPCGRDPSASRMLLQVRGELVEQFAVVCLPELACDHHGRRPR